MRLTKKILMLVAVLSVVGCVENETTTKDVKNEESNKAYTENENGEMIFYDLKKPSLDVKSKIDENEINQEKLKKLIQGRSDFVNNVEIYKVKKLTVVDVILNKVQKLNDEYIEQLSFETFVILKSILSFDQIIPNQVVLKQNFDDGSSLNIVYENFRGSQVKKENIFLASKVGDGSSKGQAKLFLEKICKIQIGLKEQALFCEKKKVNADDGESLKKDLMEGDSQDGKKNLILEEKQASLLKKEQSLSEDQKKILEEAGFDVVLN